MSKDLLSGIEQDHFRRNLSKYTRKAFLMLPKLGKPRILDIGCGSGVPTIELAKLSNGEITGIDIDQNLLDRLNGKIAQEGLLGRVRTMRRSLFDIDFPDESFDIIWAEGSISIIGFENGLRAWKRLLRTNGFLVVHDETKDLSARLKAIPSCGYRLANYLPLPEDAWWTEYYEPLEKRTKELRTKLDNDPEALKLLQKYQDEIDMVKANPRNYGSAFYIMQKT